MNILLNDEPLTLDVAYTIKQLLIEQGYNEKLVAVATNGEFLPKTDYERTEIKDGDKIEIVAPMQGG